MTQMSDLNRIRNVRLYLCACMCVRACACESVLDGADERYLGEGPQEGAGGGAGGGEGGRDGWGEEDAEEGEDDGVLTLASGETCVAQSVEELLMSELVCTIFVFMTCVR
jgi:hypothetical protein